MCPYTEFAICRYLSGRSLNPYPGRHRPQPVGIRTGVAAARGWQIEFGKGLRIRDLTCGSLGIQRVTITSQCPVLSHPARHSVSVGVDGSGQVRTGRGERSAYVKNPLATSLLALRRVLPARRRFSKRTRGNADDRGLRYRLSYAGAGRRNGRSNPHGRRPRKRQFVGRLPLTSEGATINRQSWSWSGCSQRPQPVGAARGLKWALVADSVSQAE